MRSSPIWPDRIWWRLVRWYKFGCAVERSGNRVRSARTAGRHLASVPCFRICRCGPPPHYPTDAAAPLHRYIRCRGLSNRSGPEGWRYAGDRRAVDSQATNIRLLACSRRGSTPQCQTELCYGSSGAIFGTGRAHTAGTVQYRALVVRSTTTNMLMSAVSARASRLTAPTATRFTFPSGAAANVIGL